jgi:hypothetical protein
VYLTLFLSQALEHVVKYMTEMKAFLYGDGGADKPAKEAESRLLASEAAKSQLLTYMCTLLAPLGFEVRGSGSGVSVGPAGPPAL